MDFDFSDEQYAFQGVIARALKLGFPLQADLSQDKGRTARMWQTLQDLGVFGLLVPGEFGGLGLGMVDLALPMEELGKAVAPLCIAHTLAAADLIVRYGTQAQKQALLPALAAGELRIAIASQETNSGYDAGDVTAVADGQGLSAEKLLVADAAGADYLLVTVKTTAGEPAVVLIERDRQGLSIAPQQSLDPAASFHRCQFSDVSIADADVLGAPSPRLVVERLFDICATLYSGMAVGIAAQLLERSVDYAGQRQQFGKPIGSFQAIKHKCADMAVAVESGRSAAYYAFWALAEDADDRSRASSMAKAWCSDAARDVCNEALQIHGGMGFTWDLGLHNHLRRSKTLEFGFGDAAFHRERVLAETLSGITLRQAGRIKTA
jgi:alkylation response protein AidB-like acyl-CoA dehydrogenase